VKYLPLFHPFKAIYQFPKHDRPLSKLARVISGMTSSVDLSAHETTKLCGTRSLFDMAVSIADQFEILPTIPRRTGRQINRAGHPADNPSQFSAIFK
jgi:hypothetical protein